MNKVIVSVYFRDHMVPIDGHGAIFAHSVYAVHLGMTSGRVKAANDNEFGNIYQE